MPRTIDLLIILAFTVVLFTGVLLTSYMEAHENCGIISTASKCNANLKCAWNDVDTPEYSCLPPPSLIGNNECGGYSDICSQYKTQEMCASAKQGCYYIQDGDEGLCIHAPPNTDLDHAHEVDYLTIQTLNKEYCNGSTFQDTNGGMCNFIPGSVYIEYHEDGTFTPQHAKPQCVRKYNSKANTDPIWYCPSMVCSDDIANDNCRVRRDSSKPVEPCPGVFDWKKYTDCGVFTDQSMFSRKDPNIIHDQGIDVWTYDGKDPRRLCEDEEVTGITTNCEYTDIHHKNGTPEHKQFCSNI